LTKKKDRKKKKREREKRMKNKMKVNIWVRKNVKKKIVMNKLCAG